MTSTKRLAELASTKFIDNIRKTVDKRTCVVFYFSFLKKKKKKNWQFKRCKAIYQWITVNRSSLSLNQNFVSVLSSKCYCIFYSIEYWLLTFSQSHFKLLWPTAFMSVWRIYWQFLLVYKLWCFDAHKNYRLKKNGVFPL